MSIIPKRHISGLILAGIFALFVGIIWSVGWSIQDGNLNLWPLVGGAGFMAFILLMSWVFRNNK